MTLHLPELAVDENNRLLRSEIYAFIGAFNELDLESFDEFSNFTDLTFVYDKLVNTMFVEKPL
jgi:hypothetical protein